MISDTNREKIKAVVLTQEEIELAIIEGKTRKYFHEKNKQYWEKYDTDETNNKSCNSGTMPTH